MSIFDDKKLDIQEKVLSLAESIQTVPKFYLVFLAIVIVLALPLKIVLSGIFAKSFSFAYRPPEIIYEQPTPEDLAVIDKKLFRLGENGYYGYVRVSNANSDLAVRNLTYRFTLKAQDGEQLDNYEGLTYVLPGQDKFIFLPLRQLTRPATTLDAVLEVARWSKVGDLRDLNLIVEQEKMGLTEEGLYSASGILRNDTAYIISTVEMGVLLYDSRREVIGVNFTILNDLRPNESRFFRVVWPKNIFYPEASDVEFKPSVNVLDSNALVPESKEVDLNPF